MTGKKLTELIYNISLTGGSCVPIVRSILFDDLSDTSFDELQKTYMGRFITHYLIPKNVAE